MQSDYKAINGITLFSIGVIGNTLSLCLLTNWIMWLCLVIFTITGIFSVVYIWLNFMNSKK